MPTLTFPLSRIEGHAQVVIDVQEGEIVAARFEAMEFRGFELLVQGVPAGQMPVIVPRICGVCSTAHHLAGVKALEDAYGVQPPAGALRMRELLMLGQMIQNQATSLFIFTFPDRLGVASIFQMDSAASEQTDRGIAARSLRVRRAGTSLITLAGGQFIHPIKAIVGGMTSPMEPERIAEVRADLEAALPLACDLFDIYWEMSLAMGERLGTWGDDQPACYLSSVAGTRPNYDSDEMYLLCADGDQGPVFAPREADQYLTYHQAEYSYADKTSYEGDVMRANSLARINLAESMGTPLADGYLKRFRERFGHPAHAILLFDLARGIELVYGLERALEILAAPVEEEQVAVPFVPRDGEGFGLVEAPRGPLIHHYVIENGRIQKAKFIIPTTHNLLAIERALLVAAERYVTKEGINLELERAVGRVVRAFDPCIACATH